MVRGMRLGIGVLTVAVAAAWLYRERLGPAAAAHAPAAPPAARVDVLYSWVDQQGVTHYEQDDGQGRRLQYDGSRITPLAPVDPGLAGRVREAVGDDSSEAGEVTSALPGASGAAEAAQQGSTTLHNLRREMEANARKMQETRAAQRNL